MPQLTNDLIRVVVERLPETDLNIYDYLPSLVAAFVGALIAFAGWRFQKKLLNLQLEHQKKQEQGKDDEQKFIAINKALFAVYCQWSSILRLKECLVLFKDDDERWHKLPMFHQNEKMTPRIDVNALSTMLLYDDADLLSELFLVQKNFDSYFSALEQRHEKRRILNELVLLNKPTIHIETELKELTNYLYTQFNALVEAFKIIKSRLRDVGKKRYPERETVRFVMDDEEGITRS